MSSWDIGYVFGEDSNQSYVFESVGLPDVDRGEKGFVFVIRCDDESVRPILSELNQVKNLYKT
ncbi:hypothetical protein Hanom_Chr01g00019591 [Helianthus anomalus]